MDLPCHPHTAGGLAHSHPLEGDCLTEWPPEKTGGGEETPGRHRLDRVTRPTCPMLPYGRQRPPESM